MSQVSQQTRQEVKNHFDRLRENIDRSIKEAQETGKKMMSVNQDEVLRLGTDVIEKSLEHTRAILTQNEQAWERQLAGSGAGSR